MVFVRLVPEPILFFQGTTPRTTFVTAVNEVIVEKRQAPAKEVLAWKPHANPVRNINTSTK